MLQITTYLANKNTANNVIHIHPHEIPCDDNLTREGKSLHDRTNTSKLVRLTTFYLYPSVLRSFIAVELI